MSVDVDGDGALDEEDVPPGGGRLSRKVGHLPGRLITCRSRPRGLDLDDLAVIPFAEAAISRLFGNQQGVQKGAS